MEQPSARIETGPNGEMILIDPVACGVITAVNEHNRRLAREKCYQTLELNDDRIEHFQKRAAFLGKTSEDTVIVIINVDAMYGNVLADMLMPNHDWQVYRDQGQVPFARGLAVRQGIQEFLAVVDEAASEKLSQFNSNELAVVVVDHGVCEVF